MRTARHLLPWLVSAGALIYVFGYAIDWKSIPEATENANLPLFIAITSFDKAAFFLVWALLQTWVIRRFIEPVPAREVLALKGGAELLRTGSNLLSDGAFLYGVSRMVKASLPAVVLAITIPFGVHFSVLLLQATIVLPLLEGGLAANRDVASFVLAGWLLAGLAFVAARFGVWRRMLSVLHFAWSNEPVNPRHLLPLFGWFALFAVFDVLIQGSASRAFGVSIDWLSLAARLPILYAAISVPSFGNFGTREIAWSNLFAEYGSREALIAFALWTNAIFAVLHVLIGMSFFGRALALLRGLRQARRAGEPVPQPLFRDAIDP